MKRSERLAFIGLVVILLLIFGSVAWAQEATETPVPDEVVVTEPVETVSNPLDVISTVIQGAIALMLFLASTFLPRLLEIIRQLKEALDLFNVQSAQNARRDS